MHKPSARFTTVHMDIVGPLETSRNYNRDGISYRYLVTFIDRYTKWVEAVPTSGISAEEIAFAFVNIWVCHWN